MITFVHVSHRQGTRTGTKLTVSTNSRTLRFKMLVLIGLRLGHRKTVSNARPPATNDFMVQGHNFGTLNRPAIIKSAFFVARGTTRVSLAVRTSVA